MYSWKVKSVMIAMVFLMTVGFAVLIIQPFIGGGLNSGDPNKATRQVIDEARAVLHKNNCEKGMRPGAERNRCKSALLDMGSGYSTLAAPDPTTNTAPAGAKRYQAKALESLLLLYAIDPTDKRSVEQLAREYMVQNKSKDAVPLYRSLAKKYPAETDYMLAWGQSAQAANQMDEAKRIYRSIIATTPDDANADIARDALKQIKDQASQGNNISLG